MADLPLPALSVTRVLSPDMADTDLSALTHSSASSKLPALLDVLRQAIASRGQSIDSILAAVADSARIVCGADGIAIASRLDGAVVCRARSGDMAPAIGAPLNSESGISGACLRTGNFLVCDDALTDSQVDADVCRALGIRSIAVLPLRDRSGVLGIIEAFSSRPCAFGAEQLDSLHALGETAEMAYESETRGTRAISAAQAEASAPAVLDSVPDLDLEQPAESGTRNAFRRNWLIGGAAVAVLLISFVIRLSWRQTGAEIASSETSSPVGKSQSGTVSAPVQTVLPKPEAAVRTRQSSVAGSKNPLKNAAQIEPDSISPARESNPVQIGPGPARKSKTDADSDLIAPPVVELAKNGATEPLIDLPVGSQPMPQFALPISKGATQAVLIQKVSPTYPPQARAQRLSGSVVLEATVSARGTVRTVKVVSGPAVLAAAAVAAVSEWRYTPGILNGKAVETQQKITVVFNLPEQPAR